MIVMKEQNFRIEGEGEKEVHGGGNEFAKGFSLQRLTTFTGTKLFNAN